jgi:hypothetical protein
MRRKNKNVNKLLKLLGIWHVTTLTANTIPHSHTNTIVPMRSHFMSREEGRGYTEKTCNYNDKRNNAL